MPMISLQIPEDILDKFDKAQKESNYMNRSEALRDAIIEFIKNHESAKKDAGIKSAVISVIYEIDYDNLDLISQIDHRFDEEIKLSSEHSLDEKRIKIYLMIGDINRINDFVSSFNQIKQTTTNMMII